MNYLAHFFLAGDDEEILVGNFLGDFIKGPLASSQNTYSDKMLHGAGMHRAIDKKADDAISNLLNSKKISFQHRRYAGITFDLACDHFLSIHWKKYSQQNLKEYNQKIFSLLENHKGIFPDKAVLTLERMYDYDWLNQYHELDFLEEVFKGISRRLKKENEIGEAIHDLRKHHSVLEDYFLSFMPEMITFAQSLSYEKGREKANRQN